LEPYAYFQLKIVYPYPIYINFPASLSKFPTNAPLKYWYRLKA